MSVFSGDSRGCCVFKGSGCDTGSCIVPAVVMTVEALNDVVTKQSRCGCDRSADVDSGLCSGK